MVTRMLKWLAFAFMFFSSEMMILSRPYGHTYVEMAHTLFSLVIICIHIRHGIHVFYFGVVIGWVVIVSAGLEVISPVSETPCNVVS